MASEPTTPTRDKLERAVAQRRDRVWGQRFFWLILLSLSGFVAYVQVVGGVDAKLTREIVRQLRQQFPQHYVTIDRARLVPGQSITIDGLRIAKTTERGPRDLLRVGKIVCQGPLDWLGLAQGQLPIESVIVDSADLSLWPLPDGTWNLQELSTDRPISKRFPAVRIRSGLIRLGHESGESGREIICHDFQAELQRFAGAGPSQPGSLRGRAGIASSHFQKISIDAWILEDKSDGSVQGTVSKLDFSHRLVEQLPACLQAQLQASRGFSGEVDASFQVSRQQGKWQLESNAAVHHGRLLHPQVPYPLEDMSFELYCRNTLLQLRRGQARSGEARVEFNADVHGFSAAAPWVATLKVENLPLDERLHRALPKGLQEYWDRFRLRGLVDASAAVAFDGQSWKPRVLVRARDGGVDPDFFPYPVSRIQGDFVYENDRITAPSLTAMAGGQSLKGSLTLQRAQPRWWMDFVVAADGPIAIDDALLGALTPRHQTESGFHRFIASLHPSGTVLLRRARFQRTADRPDAVSRSLELTFSECSIKYDGFRYPIVDVHGQATLDNDRLVLREFVGRNDGGRIKGEGFGQCRNSSLESIDLIFQAFNVALDEELYQALPASARNLWEQLQPNGSIDRLAIQIRRDSAIEPLDLRVEMTEEHDPSSNGARGISFRPLTFPYVIDDVACSIDYRPGRIGIRALSGVHDASRIQTEGQILLHTDGSWDGQLTWLPSTRFLVDQVLLSCLPSVLREPLTRVSFQGPVGITGSTRVASLNPNNSSLVRSWQLRMDLEDAQLGGDLATGVRGSLQVLGESTSDATVAYGNVAIDALAVKNIAVTGLDGPFVLDGHAILLGRDAAMWQASRGVTGTAPSLASMRGDASVVPAAYFASSPTNATGRPETADATAVSPFVVPPPSAPTLDIHPGDMRARTLSGTVFLSGIESINGERSRYRVRLVDADLHGFLVDLGETHTQANGKLSIQCDLSGSLANTDSLEGAGRAWLRGANLYELPAMIRLFRLLSVRPDQGAFDSADIAFSIDGDRIPVHELELDGDLVSMRGAGWVNLRREMYLDLYAYVGRRSLVGALIRPLTQHRAANLMRIEVFGSTSNLQMKRSMPLMESLEQVFPETP